ncbi:MAG: 5-formyltetrahydrofolate cyclo-ligase, partial [Eubacteriales bacterium]
MYEIRLAKERIRSQFLEKRRSIPAELKAEYDEAVCRRFMSLVTYRYAEAILMYAPKGSEIDVTSIARHALECGKIVAYPRCDSTRCTMDYHIVTSLEQLEKGSYGIFEPSASLPVYNPRSYKNAACIIPALVYDRSGYRLGYGKGYYDRYLTAFTGVKTGFV